MRILFLLNAFEPDGPGRLVFDIACRLRSIHGCECEVAAMSRGGILQEKFEAAGLRTSVLGGGVLQSIRQLKALLRSGNFDVLHTHLLRADIIGRSVGKRLGIPRILSTEHGLHTWSVMGPLLKPLFGWGYRRSAKNTHAIVAVSEFVQRQLMQAGLPETQVRLIRNGVDLQLFKPMAPEERRTARRKLGLDEEAVLFVAAGKMVPMKGHLVFCEAMERVLRRLGQSSCIQAAIAGDGPEFARCKQFIREKGMEKSVVLMGRLGDEMPDLIACADVVVQPSLIESFGLVPAQALACAVPVIATTADALPEIIREGETGCLVRTGDAEALCERIISLAGNASARAALGEMGLAFARRNLDIERTVASYLALYRN